MRKCDVQTSGEGGSRQRTCWAWRFWDKTFYLRDDREAVWLQQKRGEYQPGGDSSSRSRCWHGIRSSNVYQGVMPMKGLGRGHSVGCRLSLGSSRARIIHSKRPALGRNGLTLVPSPCSQLAGGRWRARPWLDSQGCSEGASHPGGCHPATSLATGQWVLPRGEI